MKLEYQINIHQSGGKRTKGWFLRVMYPIPCIPYKEYIRIYFKKSVCCCVFGTINLYFQKELPGILFKLSSQLKLTLE